MYCTFRHVVWRMGLVIAMAKIVYLGANQRPPDEQDWILVERASSGAIHIQTCIIVEKAGVLVNHGSFSTLSDALEFAQRHADEHSMATIYAKGIPESQDD